MESNDDDSRTASIGAGNKRAHASFSTLHQETEKMSVDTEDKAFDPMQRTQKRQKQKHEDRSLHIQQIASRSEQLMASANTGSGLVPFGPVSRSEDIAVANPQVADRVPSWNQGVKHGLRTSFTGKQPVVAIKATKVADTPLATGTDNVGVTGKETVKDAKKVIAQSKRSTSNLAFRSNPPQPINHKVHDSLVDKKPPRFQASKMAMEKTPPQFTNPKIHDAVVHKKSYRFQEILSAQGEAFLVNDLDFRKHFVQSFLASNVDKLIQMDFMDIVDGFPVYLKLFYGHLTANEISELAKSKRGAKSGTFCKRELEKACSDSISKLPKPAPLVDAKASIAMADNQIVKAPHNTILNPSATPAKNRQFVYKKIRNSPRIVIDLPGPFPKTTDSDIAHTAEFLEHQFLPALFVDNPRILSQDLPDVVLLDAFVRFLEIDYYQSLKRKSALKNKIMHHIRNVRENAAAYLEGCARAWIAYDLPEDVNIPRSQVLATISNGSVRISSKSTKRKASLPEAIVAIPSVPTVKLTSPKTGRTSNNDLDVGVSMTTTIFVDQIPLAANVDDLKSFFADYTVNSIQIPVERSHDGQVRNRGFAYVELDSAEEANGAIHRLSDRNLMDCKIRIGPHSAEHMIYTNAAKGSGPSLQSLGLQAADAILPKVQHEASLQSARDPLMSRDSKRAYTDLSISCTSEPNDPQNIEHYQTDNVNDSSIAATSTSFTEDLLHAENHSTPEIGETNVAHLDTGKALSTIQTSATTNLKSTVVVADISLEEAHKARLVGVINKEVQMIDSSNAAAECTVPPMSASNSKSDVEMVDASNAIAEVEALPLAISDSVTAGMFKFYYPGRHGNGCVLCSKLGHTGEDCPDLTCKTCGLRRQHFTKACPESQRCSKCRGIGHSKEMCLEKLKAPKGEPEACSRCHDSHSHDKDSCSWLWRTYEPDLMTAKISAGHIYCYSCGDVGHFGTQCGIRKPGRLLTDGITWSMSNFHKHVDVAMSAVSGVTGGMTVAVTDGRINEHAIIRQPPKRAFSVKGLARNDPIELDSEADDQPLLAAKLAASNSSTQIRIAKPQTWTPINPPLPPGPPPAALPTMGQNGPANLAEPSDSLTQVSTGLQTHQSGRQHGNPRGHMPLRTSARLAQVGRSTRAPTHEPPPTIAIQAGYTFQPPSDNGYHTGIAYFHGSTYPDTRAPAIPARGSGGQFAAGIGASQGPDRQTLHGAPNSKRKNESDHENRRKIPRGPAARGGRGGKWK